MTFIVGLVFVTAEERRSSLKVLSKLFKKINQAIKRPKTKDNRY